MKRKTNELFREKKVFQSKWPCTNLRIFVKKKKKENYFTSHKYWPGSHKAKEIDDYHQTDIFR